MAARQPLPTARRGFTLVELLVVMAVMAILGSLAMYALGPWQDHSAVSNAALVLQTQLNSVRQRALRDIRPAGMRLLPGDSIPNTSNPNVYYITKLVYLELGDDIVGKVWHDSADNNSNAKLQTDQAPLPVQLGNSDYIEINGGLPRRITNSTTGKNGNLVINLQTGFPYTIQQSANLSFRVIRQPVVVGGSNGNSTSNIDGEDIVQMPRSTMINLDPATELSMYYGGIDLTNASQLGNSAKASYIPKSSVNATTGLDIMFAPNGSLIWPQSSTPVVLWVCSTSTNPDGRVEAMRGQPSLVVIYPRTGQVASYEAGTFVNASGQVNAFSNVQ
jgi:prepilin-type N-terminal cleavage/methylation domain-containing protein